MKILNLNYCVKKGKSPNYFLQVYNRKFIPRAKNKFLINRATAEWIFAFTNSLPQNIHTKSQYPSNQKKQLKGLFDVFFSHNRFVGQNVFLHHKTPSRMKKPLRHPNVGNLSVTHPSRQQKSCVRSPSGKDLSAKMPIAWSSTISNFQ